MKNITLIIIKEEEKYDENVIKFLKENLIDYNKICYLCLTKTFDTTKREFKKNDIDTNKFFFIDILSTHYKKQTPEENCKFIKSPQTKEKIKKTIIKSIKQNDCDCIIIDNIFSLLNYQENFDILKFTHCLKDGEISKLNIKESILISLKEFENIEDIYEDLIKDISMFSDKVLELNHTS